MQTRIQKWGNSLALRIPKAFAAEVGLQPDTVVEISVIGGQIVIAPAAPVYDLDDLLAAVTPDNRHGETDTGAPVGNEVW
ncbi:MAG: multidrug transporter MatE [Chloroflexota bacterium]|nr:MAG: multidrug transporter MatE [Chloroflexota bacterium]